MRTAELVEIRPSWQARARRLGSLLRELPLFPASWLFLVVFVAVFANVVSPYDAEQYWVGERMEPPFWQEGGSWSHILGTDHMGRDMVSRLFLGARVSVMVVFIVILSSAFIGSAVGLISGFTGGWVDEILMRFVDIWISIPRILMALVLISIFKPSLMWVIIVIVITTWARTARIVRGEVLSVKQRDYVALAKVVGCSPARIMVVHIFPQVLNTLVVLLTLQVGTVMLFEAALSFLGLGVQPPTPTWGSMLSEGRGYISTAWWFATVPGIAILFTVLSANLFGDWLRDKLDPRLRQL